MIIFCRLPPDSVLVVCDAEGVLISKLSMDSAAKSSMLVPLSTPARANLRLRWLPSTRFSLTLKSIRSPCAMRSAGTVATPSAATL